MEDRVVAEYNRLKALEPERIRQNNYCYFARAYTGNACERTDAELLTAARIEIERIDAYLASPPGRYAQAMRNLLEMAESITSLANAGLSAQSRGWDANREFAHGLASDLGATSARAVRLAAMAQGASE